MVPPAATRATATTAAAGGPMIGVEKFREVEKAKLEQMELY
eukprot:CAMPEP_0180355406 /NCGR_PEP_ID=MMETSP0989-20121125/8758_1 /TAXON_ID=697907 /ORGANISM="non described non described, Strain CCMP2293" /LENGTH=40 /DNA_ID= /DNA_START= /DNA_END= /DNA_ORIENTATION=